MRLCFVTVGATAPFEKLVQTALSAPFLEALASNGYTHLMIQYGKNGKVIMDTFLAHHPEGSPGLHGLFLGGFDFRPDLSHWIGQCMERPDLNQELGLVISHAGTGTILEALRSGPRLIIVPNTDLADNHQQDMANMMSRLEFATSVDTDGLVAAIGRVYKPAGDSNVLRSYEYNKLPDVVGDQLGLLD